MPLLLVLISFEFVFVYKASYVDSVSERYSRVEFTIEQVGGVLKAFNLTDGSPNIMVIKVVNKMTRRDSQLKINRYF